MKRTVLLLGLVLGIGCLVGAQEGRGPAKGDRPIGTWEQTTGDVKITLTVAADRLHISAAGKDNKPLWLIDADYSITKDSILYGIVTSVEEEKALAAGQKYDAYRRRYVESTPPSAALLPPVSAVQTPPPPATPATQETVRAPQLGMSVDDLFSFRFRVDDDILTIKETKTKTSGGRGELLLHGRFKKKGEAGEERRFDKDKEKKEEKRDFKEEKKFSDKK